LAKTKLIAVRLPEDINKLLEKVCIENKKTFTSNLIDFLEKGMIRNNIMNKVQNFLNEQEILMMKAIGDQRLESLGTEAKVFERDQYKCRKCGSTKDILTITLPSDLIGKTFAGLDAESQITLCPHCLGELNKFIPKRYELERFIEWYYK
jgi:hypothetical protein